MRNTPALILVSLLALGACGEDSLPMDAVETKEGEGEVMDLGQGGEDSLIELEDVGPLPPLDTSEDTSTTDANDALSESDDALHSEDVTEPLDIEEDTSGDISDEPFICTDDASCEGRIEVNACQKARCVAGHCAALGDEAMEGQSCDDANPCTTLNLCQEGLCSSGVPIDCSALASPPCTLSACDPNQGGCIALQSDEGIPCDDNDPCTQGDQCSAGQCLGLSLCDDGDVCNGYESCEPESGACTSGMPLECEGTNPCLGISFCDSIFGCVVGAPPDCGDFVCGDEGCPTSCTSHEECIAGRYCSGGACVPTKDAGASCEESAMCQSAYCESNLCCAGGECCTEDSQCPLKEVDVLLSQELFDPTSGFARAIITETTSGIQSFIAPNSGVLERIDFMLQTNANEGYLLSVNVWNATPNQGGNILGSTTLLAVADSSDPSLWTATFNTPISLSAGQSVGLELSWLNGDADCESNCAVIWLGAEGDPYPEGTVLRSFDSGQSWQFTTFNDDLWFRIWAGQHSCTDFTCDTEANEP